MIIFSIQHIHKQNKTQKENPIDRDRGGDWKVGRFFFYFRHLASKYVEKSTFILTNLEIKVNMR